MPPHEGVTVESGSVEFREDSREVLLNRDEIDQQTVSIEFGTGEHRLNAPRVPVRLLHFTGGQPDGMLSVKRSANRDVVHWTASNH